MWFIKPFCIATSGDCSRAGHFLGLRVPVLETQAYPTGVILPYSERGFIPLVI